MARDVTLRATASDEFVGDETYELWLKHESDAWDLVETGDVVLDVNSQQEFVLLTLIEGDDYVAQIRTKRAGRYRSGYLTSNPDTWPEASRCEFTPGALAGTDAPVIVSATWSRTSAVATKIAVVFNADDLAKDVKLYDGGVLIATVAQPHVNPVTYNHVDPTLAALHSYTAKHSTGSLVGPISNTVDEFAGPEVPTGFDQTSAVDQYGKYNLAWDADDETVRVQDDFVCSTVFATVYTGTDSIAEITKEVTELPPGGTQPVAFQARIRREIESFGVVDVSAWDTINIEMEIDDDNTEFDSCP